MSTGFSDAYQSSTKLIPVSATRISGSTARGLIPRTVSLSVGYYQQTTSSRQINQVSITFSDFDSDASNMEYDFTFKFYAMSWLDCLDYFAYDSTGYFLVILLICSVTCGLVICFWAYHYRRSTILPRPQLHLKIYLTNVLWNALAGIAMAVAPMVACMRVMVALLYDAGLLDLYPANYSDQMDIDPTTTTDQLRIASYRNQRLGTVVFAVGLYIVAKSISILVPPQVKHQKLLNRIHEEEKQLMENSPSSKALERFHLIKEDAILAAKRAQEELFRKRGFLTFNICWVLAYTTPIFIFSQSTVFADNNVVFVVLMKVGNFLLTSAIKSNLDDEMLATPLTFTVGVVGLIITLSAGRFTQYILSVLIQLFIEVLVRTYVNPNRQWFADRVTELKKKLGMKVLELRNPMGYQNALQNDGLRDLVTNAVQVLTNSFFPMCLLFFYTFHEALDYGVSKDFLQIYIAFAFVLFLAHVVNDTFIANAMQCRWAWKLHVLLKDCKQAYTHRTERWVLSDADPKEESEFVEPMRLIYKMGFSTQYFFVVTFLGQGLLLLVESIQMWMLDTFNPFQDLYFLALVLLTFAVAFCVEKIFIFVGLAVGVWSVKKQDVDIEDQPNSPLSGLESEESREERMNRFNNRTGIPEKDLKALVAALEQLTLVPPSILREIITENIRTRVQKGNNLLAVSKKNVDKDGEYALKLYKNFMNGAAAEDSGPQLPWAGDDPPPSWPPELQWSDDYTTFSQIITIYPKEIDMAKYSDVPVFMGTQNTKLARLETSPNMLVVPPTPAPRPLLKQQSSVNTGWTLSSTDAESVGGSSTDSTSALLDHEKPSGGAEAGTKSKSTHAQRDVSRSRDRDRDRRARPVIKVSDSHSLRGSSKGLGALPRVVLTEAGLDHASKQEQESRRIALQRRRNREDDDGVTRLSAQPSLNLWAGMKDAIASAVRGVGSIFSDESSPSTMPPTTPIAPMEYKDDRAVSMRSHRRR
eukprot:GILK01013236.1.p1 GENE.GILK01013236.1~~GILK01013236.1.p1  ORF type:complete len:1146 (+),score=203.97 GILK01013236.1:493-3438(+)